MAFLNSSPRIMPSKKFQPPIYPRPVSPICADEIPVCKDTVIFFDNYESSSDAEKKAAKRARIEAHATNYLRGQPPFILTAGLKGPFEGGWQNPWAKKSKAGTVKKRVKTQKFPGKIAKPLESTEHPTPASTVSRGRDVSAEKGTGLLKRKRDQSTNDEDVVFGHARKKVTMEASSLRKRLGKNDLKKGDWLKTNGAYKTEDKTHPDPSPQSPTEGKLKHQKNSNKLETEAVTRDDIAGGENRLFKRGGVPKPAGNLGKHFSAPLNSRVPLASDDRRVISGASTTASHDQTHLQHKQGDRAKPSYENESRAEYSILKARRAAIQRDTVAVDSNSPLPHHVHPHIDLVAPVEPQADLETHPSKSLGVLDSRDVNDAPLASNEAQGSLRTTQEDLSSKCGVVKIPLHEQLMVESNVTPELPSAQAPLVSMLPSLPADISSHERMLPDSPHQLMTVANGSRDIGIPPDLEIVSLGEVEHPPRESAPEQGPALSVSPAAPAPNPYDGLRRDSDCNATPLPVTGFVSVMEAALEQSATTISKITAPVSVRKAVSQKLKKRQAFATEEKPSGSIKSALKVGKLSATRLSDDKVTKPDLRCPNDEQKKENHVQGTLGHGELSPRLSRGVPSKSILKSSFQHPVATSVSNNSGSLSTKQDAQAQKKLKPIENDDDFDLEGAMDDLGSYLDTWDAEKQAAGIS